MIKINIPASKAMNGESVPTPSDKARPDHGQQSRGGGHRAFSWKSLDEADLEFDQHQVFDWANFLEARDPHTLV